MIQSVILVTTSEKLQKLFTVVIVLRHQDSNFKFVLNFIQKRKKKKLSKVFKLLLIKQGHPTSIFGKYLFGRLFEIQNFRNICCKISRLPAFPRIFEHLKMVQLPIFSIFLPYKGHLEFSGAFFLAEIFEKASFDPYNFWITRLSARKSEQMKNFQGIKICLYLLFSY